MAKLGPQSVSRFKALLFLLGLFPLARWVWLGWHDQLTANPTEFLTRSSGTWALVCLLVTLSVSPLRQIIDEPALIRVRRLCGLFAFFYGALHALAWAWWEQGFEIDPMLADIVRRPFISAGAAAFLLMLSLAGTSSRAAMRWLGVWWKRLHRSIYLIGILVIVHYAWHKAGKNDFSEVAIYGALMAVLLAWRLVAWVRTGIKKA